MTTYKVQVRVPPGDPHGKMSPSVWEPDMTPHTYLLMVGTGQTARWKLDGGGQKVFLLWRRDDKESFGVEIDI